MSGTGPTFRTPLEVRSIPRSRWEAWIAVGAVPWTEFADDCRDLAEIIHRAHANRIRATSRTDTTAARPASTATANGTVGHDPRRDDVQATVILPDVNRDDTDAMKHVTDSRWTEDDRQAFLRRVQRVDPRERRVG